MLTDAVENWMRRNCIGGQMPQMVRDLMAAAKARSVGFFRMVYERNPKNARGGAVAI